MYANGCEHVKPHKKTHTTNMNTQITSDANFPETGTTKMLWPTAAGHRSRGSLDGRDERNFNNRRPELEMVQITSDPRRKCGVLLVARPLYFMCLSTSTSGRCFVSRSDGFGFRRFS